MWLKFIFFILFSFTGSMSEDAVEPINAIMNSNLIQGTVELDQNNVCTRPGIHCLNCTTPVMCLGNLMMPMDDCPFEFTCNGHLGQCTRERHAPECSRDTDSYTHDCQQAGIFPHPTNCHIYYFCTPDESGFTKYEAQCPRNFGFNVQTGQCSTRLQNNQCAERIVPICNSFGQNGALRNSTNYYYVCLKISRFSEQLVPRIFICPNGGHFWGGFCHSEPENPEGYLAFAGISPLSISDVEDIETATVNV